MNPKQTIRAMKDVNGEVITPNWRKYDAEELEARGLRSSAMEYGA